MTSIATLQRITAPKLADLLREAADPAKEGVPSVAVVDVRDDDYIGGHIRGGHHFPSRSLDATMPTLLRKVADKDAVVFHCALSQQRGPGAALRYMREREARTATKTGEEQKEQKAQAVYVLDKGFVGWQELYGRDETLTEGWRREIWEEED